MHFNSQSKRFFLVFFIIFILSSLSGFASLFRIIYEGQQNNPEDGVKCDEVTACSSSEISLPGQDCCKQKACQKELPYYYAYYYNDEGWAFSDVAYIVNYDENPMGWSCGQCGGVWEPTADNGNGECCGDDHESVEGNPEGINTNVNGDDPDMGPLACIGCKRGINEEEPGLRHWGYSDYVIPSSNRCCGDDDYDCGAVFAYGDKVITICSDIPGDISTYTSGPTECTDSFGNPVPCQQELIQETLSGPWAWIYVGDMPGGIIISSPCSKNYMGYLAEISYLSNGEEWIACTFSNDQYIGASFDLQNDYMTLVDREVINPYNDELEHGYICYNDIAKFQIAECCGEFLEECNNNNAGHDYGGTSLLFGGSVPKINGKTFFCIDDYIFSEDLDSSPYACSRALYPNGTRRGYLWTGTACCSEPQDGEETYNDADGYGACFKGNAIANGAVLPNLPELTSINGILTGCMVNITNYKIGNSTYPNLIDSYTQEHLVQSVPYCTIEQTGSYYCDVSGKWKFTNYQNISSYAKVPQEWMNSGIGSEGGCCPPNKCWNGTACFYNQAPFQPPDQRALPPRGTNNKGYRCADGSWIYSELKKDLNGRQGYCPRNSQCLAYRDGSYSNNNNPSAPNPMCIESGQYINDHYCDNGNWSSRTKFMALALLDIVKSNPSIQDYTLYCAPPEDALNYIDYFTEENVYVKGIFEEGAANNVCLLEFSNKLILAVSLNSDPEEAEFETAQILPEFEDCDYTQGQGFISCNQENKAWFNKELKSILYSSSGFQLNSQPVFSQLYNTYISTELTGLLRSVQAKISTLPFSYTFIDQGLTFDRLFAAKKGSKNILATLDEDTIIVRYGYIPEQDVCEILNTYNQTYSSSNSQIACFKTPPATGNGNTYDIIAKGGQYANIRIYEIWPDLTGKLRLQ